MTQRERFSRREVERSFRKFSDLVKDLVNAKFQTWGDSFTHLITHCENDPVMQVVTGPLKSDPRIDAQKWWSDAVNSVRGMIGTGSYKLPTNDDERTALLYQVLLRIEHDNWSIDDFCVSVYGTTDYQEMVNTFNRELVHKFTREVLYRLDEIAKDTADQNEISREAMVVFHHHDYSTNISGTVQGSNIATGIAQISSTNAQFNSPSDVAAELRALKSLASEYSKANQETISKSLELLASWTESQDADTTDVVEHVRAIAEISPNIKGRLREILMGTGTSMLGSVIVEGLKAFFSS